MKKSQVYTWLVLLVIFLLILPKVIDFLFSFYLCDLTALNDLRADAVLNYLGAIIGGLCALVAVVVAVNQFSIEKKPIIIPRHQYCYMYLQHSGQNFVLLEKPNEEDREITSLDHFYGSFIYFKFDNVTPNTALTTDIKIDYKNGNYYKTLCDLLGGEPKDRFSSSFETENYSRIGIFNGTSERNMELPGTLAMMVKGIIHKLNEPGIDSTKLALRYNHFINQKHKIAEIVIITSDIANKINEQVFDVEIGITSLLSSKANYEVSFIFVMKSRP